MAPGLWGSTQWNEKGNTKIIFAVPFALPRAGALVRLMRPGDESGLAAETHTNREGFIACVRFHQVSTLRWRPPMALSRASDRWRLSAEKQRRPSLFYARQANTLGVSSGRLGADGFGKAPHRLSVRTWSCCTATTATTSPRSEKPGRIVRVAFASSSSNRGCTCWLSRPVDFNLNGLAGKSSSSCPSTDAPGPAPDARFSRADPRHIVSPWLRSSTIPDESRSVGRPFHGEAKMVFALPPKVRELSWLEHSSISRSGF